jgi:hypothetical protein
MKVNLLDNSFFLGTRVYRDIISEHTLIPSIDVPSVVNVAEPFTESQGFLFMTSDMTYSGD